MFRFVDLRGFRLPRARGGSFQTRSKIESNETMPNKLFLHTIEKQISTVRQDSNRVLAFLDLFVSGCGENEDGGGETLAGWINDRGCTFRV